MPIVVTSVAIAAGQSLSAAADASAGGLIRINMPAAWTPANVTFQVSDDAVSYRELVDPFGRAIDMTVRAGTAVELPGGFKAGWLKIRSGTLDGPIVQAATRTFELVADR